MTVTSTSEKPSQQKRYCAARERNSRENETFLNLVSHGMKKRDLQRCIANRPHYWGKYSHWLAKLPE